MNESKIIFPVRQDRKIKPTLRRIITGSSITFFIILTLTGGTIYLLRRPDLQIKNIEVTGLKEIKKEDIEVVLKKSFNGYYAAFIPQGSFPVVKKKEIEKEIKENFPKIKSVYVTKKFPVTIKINIEEREFWAIFCAKDNVACVFIDKTGFGYKEAPHTTGSLILRIKSDFTDIKIPSQILEEGITEKLISSGHQVKKGLNEDIIGYEVSKDLPKEPKLITQRGYAVLIDTKNDLEKTLRVLKTVLEKEIENKVHQLDYIDLRFGNKVFYKLKGQ